MSERERMRRLFQVAAFLLGTCGIAYGVSRNETGIVLRKALRICMECIGLG